MALQLGLGLLTYSFSSSPLFNCLSHSRLLLQLTQSQQASFALESNLRSQKEIDDKVAWFGLTPTSLLLLSKVRERCSGWRFLRAARHRAWVRCLGRVLPPAARHSPRLITCAGKRGKLGRVDALGAHYPELCGAAVCHAGGSVF